MAKFKAGDKVRLVKTYSFFENTGHNVGEVFEVADVFHSGTYGSLGPFVALAGLDEVGKTQGHHESRFELATGLILGIMANAGAGKDTAADHLVAKHGFVKMSLADEMKRICRKVYDFSNDQLWGPSHMRNEPDRRYPRSLECQYKGKQAPKHIHICAEDADCYEYLSPRIALQTLGTEFGRFCYENTWIESTLRDAQKVLSGDWTYTQSGGVYYPQNKPSALPTGVVIPDVRFRNEMEAIQKAGGKVVRLVRGGIQAGSVGIKGHASEMEQGSIPDSDLDAVIMVPEGIPAFQAQIDAVLPRLVQS